MVDNDRIEIFIRGIFRLENEIRLAVVEAKTTQRRGMMTGGGGHAVVSDPTAATATRHLSELRSVRVGERIIKKPETWLRVIALTYKLAPLREREIMRKHYAGNRFTKEFAKECGYEPSTLYAFRKNFEWRAVAVACQLGVLAVVDDK